MKPDRDDLFFYFVIVVAVAILAYSIVHPESAPSIGVEFRITSTTRP